MGDLEESYVTRKPMSFTLIVLVIILIILTPVYFYMKYLGSREKVTGQFLAESYSEVDYWFNTESDLTENDKKTLFRINYEGNTVQWRGTLVECTPVDGIFKVGASHKSAEFPDALFMTEDDCTGYSLGSTMTYRMRLIEWKVNSFIGDQGSIISVTD